MSEATVTKPNVSKLNDDLAEAVNVNAAENGSNTPDFILGDFLAACLRAFDEATIRRAQWYGSGVASNESIKDGGGDSGGMK